MLRPDSLDTSDVEGAQTRQLPVRYSHHPFNTNLDIDRSTPVVGRDKHPGRHTRCTNALDPQYKLPSFAYHEPEPMTAAPRDVMWTLPQHKWRPAQRDRAPWSDDEKYGRQFLFHRNVNSRSSMVVADITGPQFKIEEQRWRQTNPLQPAYYYDGAAIDQVNTRRPHYGSQFPREDKDDFALRTDDILTEKIFNREYPKALIKTRAVNRTDDITGAQSDTRSSAPRLWKIKDPSRCVEKLTNRVMDIEGALAGTGGQGPPLYRTRKQAAAIANLSGGMGSVGSRSATPSAFSGSAAAAAARVADIEAVKALQ